MRISGVSLNEFRAIVAIVSDSLYHGNVIVAREATDLGGIRKPRISARLTVQNSYAYGARTSWSGRHMPAASWEAYRDVLAELFDRHPDALVRTALAVYRRKEGFEREYPQTGYRNIGSQMIPATMPELSVGVNGDPRPNRSRSRSFAAVAVYHIKAVEEEWSSEQVAEWLMSPEGTRWSKNRHDVSRDAIL
jgi:hypothetical protein